MALSPPFPSAPLYVIVKPLYHMQTKEERERREGG